MHKLHDLYDHVKWTVMCNGGRHTVEVRPSGKIIFHGHPDLEMAKLFVSADEGSEDKWKCFRIADMLTEDQGYRSRKWKVKGTTMPQVFKGVMHSIRTKRSSRHYTKQWLDNPTSWLDSQAAGINDYGAYHNGSLIARGLQKMLTRNFQRAFPRLRKDGARLAGISTSESSLQTYQGKPMVSANKSLSVMLTKSYPSISRRSGGVAHKKGKRALIVGEAEGKWMVVVNYCNRNGKAFMRIEGWPKYAR